MPEPWELRWLDYYEVLGLSQAASAREVRSAFRQKANLSHPDRYQGDSAAVRSEAERLFKQVNEAHEVLRDSTRRELYDDVWLGAATTTSILEVEPQGMVVPCTTNNVTIRSRLTVRGRRPQPSSALEVTCEDPDFELQDVRVKPTGVDQAFSMNITLRADYMGKGGPVQLGYRFADLIASQLLVIDTNPRPFWLNWEVAYRRYRHWIAQQPFVVQFAVGAIVFAVIVLVLLPIGGLILVAGELALLVVLRLILIAGAAFVLFSTKAGPRMRWLVGWGIAMGLIQFARYFLFG